MSLVHVAGDPALDFLGTLSERRTTRQEELVTAEVLGRWYLDAGIVTSAPSITRADLDRARALREQLFEVVTSWMRGDREGGDARHVVNGAAATAPPKPQLLPDGSIEVVGDAAACLSGVARSALRLMRTVDPGQVRWCADPTCTHPFLDTSRAQARRWCDMGSCGTRNKQRAHRARHAGSSPGR